MHIRVARVHALLLELEGYGMVLCTLSQINTLVACFVVGLMVTSQTCVLLLQAASSCPSGHDFSENLLPAHRIFHFQVNLIL